MRIRNIQKRIQQLTEYNQEILNVPEQMAGIWLTHWDKQQLYLEIGAGKGTFISELGLRHPDDLFVGIERFAPVLVSAAQKIRLKQLQNVRLLDADAKDLLHIFVPGEVDGIYLNFSDPWPKKRHANRRLTHPDFLDIYLKILKPGGMIQFKTDNANLFEYSLNQFADKCFRLHGITFDLHRSSYNSENIRTEYESRYAEAGISIFRCCAYKEGEHNEIC